MAGVRRAIGVEVEIKLEAPGLALLPEQGIFFLERASGRVWCDRQFEEVFPENLYFIEDQIVEDLVEGRETRVIAAGEHRNLGAHGVNGGLAGLFKWDGGQR